MYLYGILTHRVWLLNSCRTRSRSLRCVATHVTTSHRSRLYTWKVRVLVAGRGRSCYCYCRSSCSLLDMTVTVFVAFFVSLFLSRTFVCDDCVCEYLCVCHIMLGLISRNMLPLQHRHSCNQMKRPRWRWRDTANQRKVEKHCSVWHEREWWGRKNRTKLITQ